jgi:hypothetical protein
MKNYFIILLTFTYSIAVFAQTKGTITRSSDYYYGEAVAEQENEASDRALGNLLQSISVGVSSQMTRVVSETGVEVKDICENVVKTYSTATLHNVKNLKNPVENGIEVFYYIEKSEVSKIFEERKKLVCDIYRTAVDCEEEANIADALKYYYFAIVLMNSIPDQIIDYQSKNLITEIPARINSVIQNVVFTFQIDKMISNKERELQYAVSYNGKDIRALDFSFWDGVSQVHVRAVDGIGIFRLVGASTSFDKIDAQIKYNYYESREELAEIAHLWNYVIKPTFKNSQILTFTSSNQNRKSQERIAGAHTQESKSNSSGSVLLKSMNSTYTLCLCDKDTCQSIDAIKKETIKFIDVLEKNDPEVVQREYKYDSFLLDKLVGLLRYNHLVLVDDTIEASVNKTFDGWEVRKIRVLANYPTLKRQATEYLILDYDKEGNLCDVNFGTMEKLYNQFVQQGVYGNDWGNRQVIVKFAEKYRTAFMTRNMSMLDSLFADESVIIVGRVLKKGKQADVYQYSKVNECQPDIQYTQYTKKQYLINQKKVFQAQKDIFLGYSTFKISKKNNMEGTYGISMKQAYAATNYADEGHLFLLVDFLQDQPQIYVRSWQPQEWNEDAIIKLANFKLNK